VTVFEQHYTPAEVAERLAISESTVLRACRDNKLKSFVVPGGRARRIPESAVLAWLEQGSSRRVAGGRVVALNGRR
jgi:excisionase family DNA binding protein